MALLASLLDDNIELSVRISISFKPFLTSLFLTFISGRSFPVPPTSKVSLAVCSAFFAAFLP